MWQGLRPVEAIYLMFVAAIIASQIARGSFDPAAVALIGIFVGLIPAGRKDRQKAEERGSAEDSLVRQSRAVIRKYLEAEDERT